MSERLMRALESIRNVPDLTIGKVVETVEEEALTVICLISIIPFMQPIPIPGLSSLLGMIALLQGVGLIFWGRPLLTQKMKDVTIPRDKFEFIYKAAGKFSSFTSKISTFPHPGVNGRVVQIISGLSIVISASFLSLPLPIPFSNLIPALSIFLICIGLLEDDVILILLGMSITVTVIWMGFLSYGFIAEQFQGWF